jgi:hypothetical protein
MLSQILFQATADIFSEPLHNPEMFYFKCFSLYLKDLYDKSTGFVYSIKLKICITRFSTIKTQLVVYCLVLFKCYYMGYVFRPIRGSLTG